VHLLSPGSPVDGAVYTSAAGKTRIRGVDNGVDILLRDITPYGLHVHNPTLCGEGSP
jgi:hypothetical protein